MVLQLLSYNAIMIKWTGLRHSGEPRMPAAALEIPVATSDDGPKRRYLARLPSMYGSASADKG
jgi:hypothetical protein